MKIPAGIRSVFGFGMICCFLLAGCTSPDLERPQIKISWGMRMESPADEAQINPNMSLMRKMVMRQMVLELPVVADSNGLPKVVPIPMGTFMTLSRQYKNRFFLALTTTRDKDLFPTGTIDDPEAWFASLEAEVDSLMALLKGYPPERIIVGNDWLPAEAHPQSYRKMLESLRSKHLSFFLYGARMDRLDEVPFWDAVSEIALDYTPTAEGDLKAISRKLNQKAGQFAVRQHQPLFIYRANIIGPEATLQVKNRLRFWPDSTQISGICINTIYPAIAARDSVTYYGLANKPELFDFLEEYRRRKP